jgi:hypothetical protein
MSIQRWKGRDLTKSTAPKSISRSEMSVEEFEKLPTKRKSSKERLNEKINQLTSSKEFFQSCVQSFYKNNPFETKFKVGIKNHRDAIRIYRNSQRDYSTLLEKEFFLERVYHTVKSWGMDSRAAQMVSIKKFKENIHEIKDLLIELQKYKLHTLNENQFENVKDKLSNVFSKLNVMESSSKLVGNSKTLHHLLPDLILPIDRKYILNFFYGNTMLNQYQEQKIFLEIFNLSYKICIKLNLNESDLGDD